MSDQTSTLLIRLLSTGDLTALTRGKESSEALKVSVEGLKRVLEGLGAGLTFAAALEGVKSSVEFGSAINDLSIQAGITTQAFQTLAYVSEAAGMKQDELGANLNVLQKNMAEAATGAGKQNKAIADLGLNTAELLAMPVEQQVEAIAKAYVNAADKGVAWAAVIALIGRNSAKIKEVLLELGEKGFAGLDKENPLKLTNADIANLDKTGDWWSKFWREARTVGAMAVARPGDALLTLTGHMTTGQFVTRGKVPEGEPTPAETEAQKQARIAAIQAQLEATIQSSPQMVAAHRALEKALKDEAKAYELPAEAARRLRAEADADMAQADKLSQDKFNAEAQLEAVKLRTGAAKLRAQANAEDTRSIREQSKAIADQLEMNRKLEQVSVNRLSVGEQIAKAHQNEAAIFKQLDALDPKSLTYDKDRLELQKELLTVKREIVALDEKSAMNLIEQDMRDEDDRRKRSAIAMAAIEHDFGKTDAEHWEQKRALLVRVVAEQERYVSNMRAIANAGGTPKDARDRASDAAQAGATALDSTREQLRGMGPSPRSFMQNLASEFTNLRNQWGTLEQQMARGLTGTISAGINSASNNVMRLLRGFQDVSATVKNVAIDIGVTLVQSFIDMGLKWVANKLMMATAGRAIAAASAAALVPIAAAQSLIWSTPATLSTIASFGGAAAQAPFSMAGAIAAGHGLALASDGGYFPGDPAKVRGLFHGDEFVWSAPAVRAVGAGNLERAHKAALGGGGGVSAGGGVSGAPGNIILAMSAEDVARSQRKYTDARVVRFMGKISTARTAL